MNSLVWSKGNDGTGPHAEGTLLASRRASTIDEFMTEVISRIGKEYKYTNCPAIIFDIWPSALHVVDSPDGAEFNRPDSEKVYVVLSDQLFQAFCDGYLQATKRIYSENSTEYRCAEDRLLNLTWSAIKASCIEKGCKPHLERFDTPPLLIGIVEGNDYFAKDILTGGRVEMLGKPIEHEEVTPCQCKFCKSQNQ